MHLIIALTLFLQSFTTVSLAQTDARYSQNNTATYKAQEKSNAIGDSLNIIIAIANGMVVKTLFMGCKPITTDMMIAGAGAGIYLVGELMTLLKYRDISKKQIDYAKNGNLTDAQVQSLEEAKKNYSDQVKAIKTKLTLLYAATAAYVAAAIAAGVQHISLKMAENAHNKLIATNAKKIGVAGTTDAATCANPSTTNPTSCAAVKLASTTVAAKTAEVSKRISSSIALEIPGASQAKAAAEAAEATAEKTEKAAEQAGAAAVTPSVTAATITEAMAEVEASGIALSTKKLATRSICDVTTLVPMLGLNEGHNPQNIWGKSSLMLVAGLLINTFNSSADASILNKFGLAAGILAAIFMHSEAMTYVANTFIYTPLGRAKLWGIMAAASGVAALTTKFLLGKAENEVKEIDAILAKYRNYKGARDISTNPIQNQIIDQSDWMRRNLKFNPDEVLAQGPALNRNGNCLFQAANGICMSARKAAQSFTSGTSGLIADTALGAGNLADSLSSGTITGANLNSAAALGNQLAKLNKVKKEIDDKLKNQFLRDENKKPIRDFDKYFNEKQMKIAKVAASKAKLTADDLNLLASAAPASMGSKDAVEQLAALSPKEDLSNVNLNTAGGGFASMPSFNFTEDKKTQEEVGASDTVSVMGGAADAEPEFAYETNRDQVHQDKNANIFEIVSHRYLRTAYPTFFTEQ